MIPLVGRTATRAARWLGTSTGRTAAGGAAAGATGGILLDDIPLLKNLDPTGDQGGGQQTLLLLALLVGGVILLTQVMD